jgi:hypothetical protein
MKKIKKYMNIPYIQRHFGYLRHFEKVHEQKHYNLVICEIASKLKTFLLTKNQLQSKQINFGMIVWYS